MATATADDREEVVASEPVALVASEPVALREQALERVKKRRDFDGHVLVYTLVNLAVWGIWTIIGANSGSWWPWPVFVTVFWGIGLVMNAWDVYFRRPISEEEVKREMEHLAS